MDADTLRVFLRGMSGQLLGGGVTGSPTPTVSGPLVRGNGTGFAPMGGWFD